MAGIDWLRLHHGTATDPKLRLVAKRAGVRTGDVVAMWMYLLEAASVAPDRGNPGALDFEAIDCAMDFDEGTAEAIHGRMVERGLVDGATGRLAAWERRQPKRERDDDTATERKRRERGGAAGVTSAGTPDAATESHVTPCHAMSRQKTPREEESREEKNSPSLRSGEPRAGAGGEPGLDPGPTVAGQACLLMRQSGVQRVNPSHPQLLELLAQGVTPSQLGDLAAELHGAKSEAPTMAYVLGVMAGRLRDAAAARAAPRERSPPLRASPAISRRAAVIAVLTGRDEDGHEDHGEVVDVDG